MAGGLAILVAEDDEGEARLLQTLLEQDGHTVTVAAHGYQALELARAGRFDVLLLDVMMPGLTGDAVARQAWLERPELPVGFITGDYGLDLVEDLGPACANRSGISYASSSTCCRRPVRIRSTLRSSCVSVAVDALGARRRPHRAPP